MKLKDKAKDFYRTYESDIKAIGFGIIFGTGVGIGYNIGYGKGYKLGNLKGLYSALSMDLADHDTTRMIFDGVTSDWSEEAIRKSIKYGHECIKSSKNLIKK